MNYYPEQVQVILAYVEGLNAADKKIADMKFSIDLPYPKKIELTDNDGTNYGTLVDEIGGAWSWEPPK